MGKMAKTSFNIHVEQATDLLEIIQTYVCGPMSRPTWGGFHYFITFTNDLSRYVKRAHLPEPMALVTLVHIWVNPTKITAQEGADGRRTRINKLCYKPT
jgi:hypothetical protein